MNTLFSSKQRLASLVLIACSATIVGCDPGQPEASSGFNATGYAAPLSQAEFNSLPAEQQYQVASKLYGTLFRGISAEDFFDMSAGLSAPQPRSSSFLLDARSALERPLTNEQLLAVNTLIEGLDEEGNPNEDDAKFSFDNDTDANENEKALQVPLARITEYPLSRDLFVQWMAYFLSNTIMYSPAVEMESTDYIDAQNMYRFLTNGLHDKRTVREMVRSNLPSLARWRVSRSSENHALEAYELYLGLFETEEDSVKGGIACKDFYLTDEDSGYVLSTTNFPNTVPQLVLETFFVTSCNDLYDVIAGHPLIMPRAVEVLTNYFFSGRSQQDRVNIINSIVSSGAETYEDIFTAMLFSREYLLNTERPRSFEENLLPILENLKWDPAAETNSSVGKRVFEFIASGTDNPSASANRGNILYLGNKGWNTMSLKIGRLPDVPLDALSFANYHKAIREQLFLNENTYSGRETDIPGLIYAGTGRGDDDLRGVVASLSLDDYLHFIFLNAIQRKASADELIALKTLFDNLNYLDTTVSGAQIIKPNSSDNRYEEVAEITLDYISRLPEFYYFKAVN